MWWCCYFGRNNGSGDVQQGSLEITEPEKLGLRLTMDDGMERYGRASGI